MAVRPHGKKWRASYRDPASGKVVHRSFDTEREALDFDREQALLRRGFITMRGPLSPTRMPASSGGPTVVKYARDLINDPTRKQNTRDMYVTALRRVEREPLGGMPLRKVTAADVRSFFASLKANRNNVRSLLAKVFNAAVRENIIMISPLAQANIRPDKPNGKMKQQRIRALTPDQVEALARGAGNDRDALCIRIGAYAGLRAGEVGGLRVEDIDFDDYRIHVRRNAQRTSAGFIFEDPKSESSQRNLKVACSLVEDVARYLENHPPLADGTIFYTAPGNPVTDVVLTAATVKAAKKAGLYRRDEDGRQWPTFHKLRNTCASLLIAAKLEPKAIQTYLGHSSIRMTYDLYGDLFPKADEPLAESMEALRAAAERKALPAGDPEALAS